MATWTGLAHTTKVLAAADAWRQKCLLQDKSVFSELNLWTKENITELKTRFVDNPILGDKPFYDKLHDQIGGAKPEISQLASEAVWLLLLFVYEQFFSVERKRARISEIWSFSGEAIPSSEYLADDCLRGFANPGTSFLTGIWREYGDLLTAMQAWKSLPSSEQSRLLLQSPWDLCHWVTKIEGGEVRAFRHMFLYFCYPDSFERSCSRKHKKRIYEAFKNKIGPSKDAFKLQQSPCSLDESILAIRLALEKEYNSTELDFYCEPLRAHWLETGGPAVSDRKIWIEKTIVKGRPDRETGPHKLGAALWSPQKSSDGRDVYANMRKVRPGDVVLHLTDNSAFTGVSIAADKADDQFKGIADTDWGEQPSYRVQLKDFNPLTPPLSRGALFSDDEIRQNLLEILNGSQGPLFYNKNLELNQGAYLTEAPAELVALLDDLYETNTGQHLLPSSIDQVEKPKPVEPQLSEAPPHIWLYAPGSKAMYWNEFHARDIAAIGWDEVGDLKSLVTSSAIKARMDQVYPEPESMVNANQCLDFAHRMGPGDWIFVKKGRREIVGFGVVKSAYRFDPTREYFRHVRDVDWQKSGSWPTARGPDAVVQDPYRDHK